MSADPELMNILDNAMASSGGGLPSPLDDKASAPIGAIPIKRVSYTHAGMIDLLIANPMISQDQLARYFGYSASWISNIIHSDTFQAALAERKDAIVDPALRESVEQNFKGLVARSLEIIRHHLDKPAQDVPVTVALKAFEVASRAAGYGAKADPRPEVNVNIHLEDMAKNLDGLLQRRKAAIEGDFSAQD